MRYLSLSKAHSETLKRDPFYVGKKKQGAVEENEISNIELILPLNCS